MIWLITASVIWGLSFGLIKGQTAGIDPFVLGVIRSAIASVFFLPWFLKAKLPSQHLPEISIQTILRASICGFIQIGLMYGPYLLSFKYLKAYEVALFTMTTPIIMAALIAINSRLFAKNLLLATALATIGGLIVAWHDVTSKDVQIGILLVQLSNLLFALGLLLWTKWFKDNTSPVAPIMFPYFAGATIASTMLALIFAHDIRAYNSHEWLVMIWLGAVASGLGFFIWNKGATQTSAPTLAVANNLKLPVAIVISIVIFGETTDYKQLILGSALLLTALKLSQKPSIQSGKIY